MFAIEPQVKTLRCCLAALEKTDLTPKQADILAKVDLNIAHLLTHWASMRTAAETDDMLHHSLNNAITPLVGYVSALRKGMAGPLDDTQRTQIHLMSEAIATLRSEIKRLRNIAAT